MRRFYLLSLLVILTDRASKVLVSDYMTLGQSIPVLPGVLHLTYIKNPGAAFGMFPGQPWFLIFVGVLIVAAMLFYVHRVDRNSLLQLALALMLGGATGNLIDRILYRGVIDFIDFRIWPVFNVADIALVAGVGVLLLDMYMDWKRSRA